MRNFRLQALILGLVALVMIAPSIGRAQANTADRSYWVSKDGNVGFTRQGKGPDWEERRTDGLVQQWSEDSLNGEVVILSVKNGTTYLTVRLGERQAIYRIRKIYESDQHVETIAGGWTSRDRSK